MKADHLEYYRKNHTCKTHDLILYPEYDALYCTECKKWLESACKDPSCVFCKNRPEYPKEE